jgi:DUF4097 and DUF4098 domain-containing protein YvlB
MAKYLSHIVLLACFAVIFSSCSIFSSKYEKIEKGEYKFSVLGKKRFSLNNINGKVKIVKSSDKDFIYVKYEKVAYVKKRQLGQPMSEITVSIDSTGSDIKLETEMENDRFGIHIGIHESNKVDYEIAVPEGMMVYVDNTNGSIEINEVVNDAKLSTVNGKITVNHSTGKLDMETSNGSIKGNVDSTKGITGSTVNGSIRFNFGPKVSAKIKADVINGSVKIDGLNMKTDKKERKYFEGILGAGDAEIKLETTNGSIRLNGEGSNNDSQEI